MKKIFVLLLVFSTIYLISCKSNSGDSVSATTATGTPPSGIAYHVDIPRSTIKWSAFKPTGTHHGTVPISKGTIYVEGGLITGGSIEMNMTALQVEDDDVETKERLEGHLKGTTPGKEEDFFNVGKFPTATYTILTSKKLENDPIGTHLIIGELNMKGITKPVNFKATLDLANAVAIKATAEPFVIDRTQWDIKYKSKKFFDNLKDDFINDEIRLEITLGAIK